MAPTEYFGLVEVVAIHESAMRRLGAEPKTLRDEGIRESATMRTQMAAYCDGADLMRQAALLEVGISQAQAILDGNKRTAYLALTTYLRMNGLLYGDRLELARQFEQIAVRSSEPDQETDTCEALLRQHAEPRSELG